MKKILYLLLLCLLISVSSCYEYADETWEVSQESQEEEQFVFSSLVSEDNKSVSLTFIVKDLISKDFKTDLYSYNTGIKQIIVGGKNNDQPHDANRIPPVPQDALYLEHYVTRTTLLANYAVVTIDIILKNPQPNWEIVAEQAYFGSKTIRSN